MPQPPDPRSFLPLTPLAFQVLLALADAPKHGYGIIREVTERTDGLIKLRTGTLYTLLQRLVEEDLIEETESPISRERAEWSGHPGSAKRSAPPKDDERRTYYELTDLGRGVVAAEARRLESLLGEARRKQVIGKARRV